jgi:hypothetical protein
LLLVTLPFLLQDVFGLYNVPLRLSYKPDQSAIIENLKFLAGNTVYASRTTSSSSAVDATTHPSVGFNCSFLNIQLKDGSMTSLLLENPVGRPLADLGAGLKALDISQLFRDERRSSAVAVAELGKLAGHTLFA